MRRRTPRESAFVAEAGAAHLRFYVTCNGFPVLDGRDGADFVYTAMVNSFLVEGSNAIGVYAARGEDDGAPRLDVDLVTGIFEDESSRHLLFNYRFQSAPHALDADLQLLAKHDIHVDRGLPPWAWEGSRPFRGDADLPAIRALFGEVRAAAERRDRAALLALYEHKVTEQATATNRSPAVAMAQMERLLDGVFSNPTYQPFFASGLVAEPWAEGRLVRVLGPEGQAPILLAGDPVALHLDSVVSHVDGAWRFVR